MADEQKAGGQAGRVKVYVRAVPREGFGGFNRAGRFWPSNKVTEAEVTRAELEALKAETTMLMVFDRPPVDFEPTAGVVETPLPGGEPGVGGTVEPGPHDTLGQAEVRGPKPQGRR
ncbi:MAG TPA: hypothetical protein VFS43_22835 [Polyangiaceae bacterium]|nr:hypothetical protein [Polyangiaceae bacterium]